jgi:DNA-binding transcriptional MocR family regulator
MAPIAAENLYVSIADRVAGLIDKGTLRPGQKAPSVRKLSTQLKVSVSTVLAAYRLLEDRGRIEARPQSGYYVRAPLAPPPSEPVDAKCARSATKVAVADPVERMLLAATDPSYVHLGGAIPAEQCLPTSALNRLSAAIARRSKRGLNTYDVPPGCPELRVQIARRYMEAGCALAPDDIVTTCGCQEALALCLRATTEPGDIVAVESPTFYGHLQLIEALGLRALEIPSSPTDGLSIEALADAIDRLDVRVCLLVTNVQNPLGTIMAEKRKQQLVKLLARHDVPLIEDDIYGDLAFGRIRPNVCKAQDTSGSILLCSSFSKTLAPGARVGWCAPGRYLSAVKRLKICTTLATPTLPQLAIAQFLATGGYEHHLRKTRAFYAEQVQLVSAAVQRHFPPGTCVTRPAGGFVVWVQMPESIDAMDLHERAMARKISIAPGSIFSAKGRFKNFIRLNCSATWSTELDRALQSLGDLAKHEPSQIS